MRERLLRAKRQLRYQEAAFRHVIDPLALCVSPRASAQEPVQLEVTE